MAQLLCVSLSNGYAIFQLNPLKKQIFHLYENQSFSNVGSLVDSDIVVCSKSSSTTSLTSTTQPTVQQTSYLNIIDENIDRVVFEVEISDSIKDIFVFKSMFSFVLKNEFRIYTFNPPMLYSQFKTSSNDVGPCDIIEDGHYFVLALIGKSSGTVRIIRNESSEVKNDISISAHSHPITIIKLSCDGSLVATASSLGTVVKLYNTKTGKLIGQFRRGTLSAEIQSITFSPDSLLVAVSSSKGTIHVFSISELVQIVYNEKTSAGTVVEIRSEIKTTCAKLGAPVLCFASNKTLYAASNSGLIATFTLNESAKTITCSNTESFIDILTFNS